MISRQLRDLTAATKAATTRLRQFLYDGDLGGAYSLIHQLAAEDVPTVMLHAGFSVGMTLDSRAFLAQCQTQLSEAARRRVDGFELRRLCAGQEVVE